MFHTCDVKSRDRNPYVFTMITMAAKSEFYENRTKIRFADITVISSNEDITYYKETIEKVKQKTNKKNRGYFPESCPLKTNSFNSL